MTIIHESRYAWNYYPFEQEKKWEEKKRPYEDRLLEVEHGTFSPLVFSTSGGMGPITTTVYKRIATIIAEKHQQAYSRTLFLIGCKLSFSVLRSDGASENHGHCISNQLA